MILGMHQYSSAGAGYRRSLEGWAKAGIRHVEPVAPLLDDFLKTDTLANAKRVLTDNGLTIVSGAVSVMNLWEPNPVECSGHRVPISPRVCSWCVDSTAATISTSLSDKIPSFTVSRDRSASRRRCGRACPSSSVLRA